MAENFIRTVDFPVSNGLQATDSVLALATVNNITNTVLVSISNLLANSQGNIETASGYTVIVSSPTVPANSTANGVSGQLSWDASYIYLCVAPGVWRRVAHSAF